MGEHRVMELLLQFITGGGINSGTIRGSTSQLWQSGEVVGDSGWGSTTSYFVSLARTLLIFAATCKKEILLGMENQRLPTPQAPRQPDSRERPP